LRQLNANASEPSWFRSHFFSISHVYLCSRRKHCGTLSTTDCERRFTMKVCPQCGKHYPDTLTLCSADGAVLQHVDDPLLGQTLAEKYLIEKLIKRGGMGAVYLGKHVLMDKTVAIKVLRPSLAADEEVVARFSREAKAASRISHPHAVSVTDFGEAENGVVFLVMEYLDGRSLKEVIRSEGPLSLDRAVEIVRQVSGALDAAHSQGVVHRDLKSDNIMLVRHNGDEWAKVLDFGIAKIKQPEGSRDVDLTAPDLVIGTPQYMSPEQCSESKAIDARSDIYSFGVILFEMLAGHVPFTGESGTHVMMKQVTERPPSLLALRPDLPVGTSDVVAKALAKLPDDRFQSAGEMSDALSRATGEVLTPSGARHGIAGSGQLPAVETQPNEPVAGMTDDLDEVTVVRAPQMMASARAVPQPGPTSVNLWRIMVPSIVALLVVFATVFLFTRNSGQTPTQQTNESLIADPNSQPVQTTSPPTGESERGFQANPVGTPPGGSANVNANQDSEPPLNVNDNSGANINENQNSAGGNKNPSQTPTPKATPVLNTPPPSPPVPKPSTEPPKPNPSPTVDR
jgi:eukaryotic-like serine/threonine-protein kinase